MSDLKYQVNKSQFAIKIGQEIFNATQVVSWAYDDIDVSRDFDFGDEQANKEYLARFESGELVNIVVFVKVFFDNFEGTDCLGGCNVRDKYLLTDIEETVKEHGMQKNARDELKKNIESTLKRLVPSLNIEVNTEYGIEVQS